MKSEWYSAHGTNVQSFIANIAFPKTLEELKDRYIDWAGQFDIEGILSDEPGDWTVPNWAKIGDIVFFMHAKYAFSTISALRTELGKRRDRYASKTYDTILEWLDRGRGLHRTYGGKIFAIARVVSSPESYPEDGLTHWKSRIYANISDRWLLDTPIDISEFGDFITVSRAGSITPVYGRDFERLREIVLQKNMDAPAYFKNAVAAPIPLSKINRTNWLEISNDYRRSFINERQFRTFYVDYFLRAFGDRRILYRECRCQKQGIPDSFVDNIILLEGKYLPVEVKLNANGVMNLLGQLKKYCNDDRVFLDSGVDRPIENAMIYKDQVLLIDTEWLYLYDDRDGSLRQIVSLDGIGCSEDIHRLRQMIVSML